MAPSADRKSDLAGSKRKAGSSLSAAQDGEGSTPKKRKIPESREDNVEYATDIGYALLEKLRKAKDKKDWHIATHFLKLPDRKLLPDYYEQIGLPVALETIESKLNRRAYRNTSAIESDVKRMIANAKQFNEKASQVFADAEKIRKMVSVYMEDRNPAYRTPGYQPLPTPIPDNWRERLKQGSTVADDDLVEAGTSDPGGTTKSTRKSGRNAAPSPASAKEERRASSTPAVADVEGAGESFEGNTFQQAQEKLILEMMKLTDDDNNLVSSNFIYLPPRALLDYYRVIKHPVSLKGLQKTVMGVKGRDPPTGQTLFKSWDALRNEVSFIWKNAREYNEDGSEISALAGELQAYFEERFAEAKRVVPEPPQPKVKLTMKAAQENPKITLKFGGQRQDTFASGTVDNASSIRQQDHMRNAANSDQNRRVSLNDNRNPSAPTSSNEGAAVIRERPSSGTSEPSAPINGVKRELSHGRSPTPSSHQTNGGGEFNITGLPTSTANSNHVQATPVQPVVNGTSYGAYNPANTTNACMRAPGKDASDALISNLNIRTHPELDTALKFEYNMTASSTLLQQSVTISLRKTQWRLLISPTLSTTLTQRPSKTFVTCNNRRLQALSQEGVDHGRPVYEHKLMPGTNTIEIEVIAGMPRGAPKIGNGPDVELEKFTVFAHYQQ